jgi:hypothetical protein
MKGSEDFRSFYRDKIAVRVGFEVVTFFLLSITDILLMRELIL